MKNIHNRSFFRIILSFVLLAAMVVNSAFAIVLAEDGETLTELITNAPNGSVIALSKDYNEALTISAGKTITIDLNGHTITANTNCVVRNNGNLTITDSAGGGRITVTAATGDISAIINESAGVLRFESGTAEAVTTTSGVSSAIRNKGKITEISGGNLIATTTGSNYSYGLWNESGTIDLISDGYIYGAITAYNNNGNNAMAINNANGTITMISGGLFVGDVRTGGGGYGIRNDKDVTVSGGAFKGNTPGNAIYHRNGTFTYASGYSLSTNEDGPRLVLKKGEYHVSLVDEAEFPIASYVFAADGTLVSKMGHTAGSYNIYMPGGSVARTEAQLADYGKNTVLTVDTGDTQPVYYFLGSSVTYGSNNSGNSYADFLEDDYDVITSKRAVSGTTLVESNGNNYIHRMKTQISPNTKIDQLIVQLSTNDAGQNKPLGSLSESYDIEDLDTYTIYGAIEYIIAYAYETWGCDVVFWTNPKYDSANYYAMYQAIFEIQQKWDIGVLDFYALGTPAAGLMSDAVHPNNAGYRWMTPIAADYLMNFKSGTEGIDQAKVDNVKELISALGEITATPEYAAKIMTAKDAYDALTPSEKKAVDNYIVLVTAIYEYNTLYPELNDGKLLDFDFEKNSLTEAGGRVTATADSAVTFVGGKETGTTAAHFTTASQKQGIKWNSRDYNPFAYAGNQVTISSWVYLDANPADNSTVYMTQSFSGDANFGFILLKANAGSWQMCMRSIAGNEFRLTSSIAPAAGKWNLVTYVQDGDIGKLYINNILAASGVMPSIASTYTNSSGIEYYSEFALGCQLNWSDPSLPGALDNFTIYNKALTTDEINDMYDPSFKTARDSYNELANQDDGRMVHIDFEDGTANDSANRITPIVGSAVTIIDEGKDSSKSASFVDSASTDSMLRWKQDEYDPFLYTDNGASVSMWINLESLSSNEVIFNYGLWGYRFILARDGENLLVSARNYDSTTSEFRVPGLQSLVGSGWTLLTLTCDSDKVYTVYFNGVKAGSQKLNYSLNDIALHGADTSKRNTSDENNQYYGYYAIGGAPYWATRKNMAAKVDDFSIYNRVLTEREIMLMANPTLTVDQEKIDGIIALIDKISGYSETFYADLEAAENAYAALSDFEKANVTNAYLFDIADDTYYNGFADANGGRYAYIDFEDGTANDVANRFTPIVGSSVTIGDGGYFGNKSANFVNSNSRNSMLRWKQDEYDPFLYSKDGASVSMWVNFENLSSNEVIFNYGLWGYRFILARDGANLLVSARNYDSTTSEFRVSNLQSLVGSGWTLLTMTCDANKIYTIYFNGVQVGRQALTYSLYDLAYEASITTKRNTSDENNQYYGYYAIGGAPYWADRVNMVAAVDDFSIYNSVLSAEEIYNLYNVTDPDLVSRSIINQINAIGTVDFSIACGKRIELARAAYDAVSDEAKDLVSNINVLIKAEEAYAGLFAGVRLLDNAAEVTALSGPVNSNAGENFDKLLDGNPNTKFGNGAYTTPFVWEVEAAVTAKYYSLTTGTDSGSWPGRNPTTWNFYGCNDYDPATGTGTWSEIAIVTNNTSLPDANSVEIRFGIDTPAEYKYYKVEFPAQGDKFMQLSEFSLYVLADVELADYSDVDAAIAEIPDDLSIYTIASVNALNRAVGAVVRGKPVTEQAVVDGYASAIRDAIFRLVINAVDMSIDISEGMVAEAMDLVNRYNITWNATIVAGENTSFEDINKEITIKNYGVYYAPGEEEITKLMAGDESAMARMITFGSGDDIDVYVNYGFRLKNVKAHQVRCAVFYLTYEYNGESYTVLSRADSVIASIIL